MPEQTDPTPYPPALAPDEPVHPLDGSECDFDTFLLDGEGWCRHPACRVHRKPVMEDEEKS